jgi:hypothetical protein
MRSPQAARSFLWLLFGYAIFLGLPAVFAPRSFYDDFPFVAHWVSMLPPYNQHLVSDVGGLYLGFAVLFAWAARSLEVALVRPVCWAFLLVSTLHLIYHVLHLDGFGVIDGIAEILALAGLLVPPVVILRAVRATGVEVARDGAS